MDIKVNFTDYFGLDPKLLDEHGLFNISLVNNLPLFVDPFLLFNSKKHEYQTLHKKIIEYVAFLRDMSQSQGISEYILKAWYCFPEVKQNWLGFSKEGNKGSGLGIGFANSLHNNLNTVFNNFGKEEISNSSHLEKLCLIRDGVGRDNISDFTVNIIKDYLLTLTENFSAKHIDKKFLKEFHIPHAYFNYETRTWASKHYTLPTFKGDYIILTPKDILTRDNTWINKEDLYGLANEIIDSIPNTMLRAQLNQYLLRALPDTPNQKDKHAALAKLCEKYPEYIDYYIRYKEENGIKAESISRSRVYESRYLFNENVKLLISLLSQEKNFYDEMTSLEAARQRVRFLKHTIENNNGYRAFYTKDGKPIHREEILSLMFRLTFFRTKFDVNSEVDNGRGAVDYKVSNGSIDSSLVEFKLASNPKLKQNLKHQVEIYKLANNTNNSVKVILYFSDKELEKVLKILKELGLSQNDDLVLIDARNNKLSASNVTD